MKPDYLYKFVSLVDDPSGKNGENEKRFHSLENDTIWFSVPGKMNDPYEFRGLYIDYDKLQQEGVSKEEINDLQRMFEEDYILSSFSHGLYSFPMWAHYANDHRGYCVKYQVLDDKQVRRVLYENLRPDATEGIKKAIETNKKLKDIEMTPEIKSLLMNLQYMLLQVFEQNYTVKHNSWSYEDEYRIIAERTDQGNAYGQNVPVKDVGLKTEAIYVGYKSGEYDRIKEIADKLGVPCYRCKLGQKDYLINAD